MFKYIVWGLVLLFPILGNTAPNNPYWSPYLNIEGGIGSQYIDNVIFANPRNPYLIQNSNNSAVALGSIAIGTSIPDSPFRLELRGTTNSQSDFNREYFFPFFFSVVGVQKLQIKSNHLMLKGYYELPFEMLTPYVNLGIGRSWNKTHATQYAPQLTGWIYDFVGTNQSNFAWSAGVGVSKTIVNHLTLNVGYNFASLGSFDTGVLPRTGDEHIFGSLYANELVIGLSYYL